MAARKVVVSIVTHTRKNVIFKLNRIFWRSSLLSLDSDPLSSDFPFVLSLSLVFVSVGPAVVCIRSPEFSGGKGSSLVCRGDRLRNSGSFGSKFTVVPLNGCPFELISCSMGPKIGPIVTIWPIDGSKHTKIRQMKANTDIECISGQILAKYNKLRFNDKL